MHAKLVAAVFVGTSMCTSANGGMIRVGEFTGEFSEGFESQRSSATAISVFGGMGSLSSGRGFNYIASRWSFRGITDPVSGSKFFGATGGPVVYDFADPMRSFGGFFTSNSGAGGGTIRFFDELDRLIDEFELEVPTVPESAFGTRTQSEWQWSGFASDVAFARVEIEGNHAGGGFVMQDDMQLSHRPIPEPATFAIASLACASWVRRRRD